MRFLLRDSLPIGGSPPSFRLQNIPRDPVGVEVLLMKMMKTKAICPTPGRNTIVVILDDKNVTLCKVLMCIEAVSVFCFHPVAVCAFVCVCAGAAALHRVGSAPGRFRFQVRRSGSVTKVSMLSGLSFDL